MKPGILSSVFKYIARHIIAAVMILLSLLVGLLGLVWYMLQGVGLIPRPGREISGSESPRERR